MYTRFCQGIEQFPVLCMLEGVSVYLKGYTTLVLGHACSWVSKTVTKANLARSMQTAVPCLVVASWIATTTELYIDRSQCCLISFDSQKSSLEFTNI